MVDMAFICGVTESRAFTRPKSPEHERHSHSPGGSIVEQAVTNLDLRPIVFLTLDEFEVSWRCLVDIVRRPILKDHVERHIELNVHFAVQFGIADTDRKSDDAVVIVEVRFAIGEQTGDRFFRVVFERKEDVVRESSHLGFLLGMKRLLGERGIVANCVRPRKLRGSRSPAGRGVWLAEIHLDSPLALADRKGPLQWLAIDRLNPGFQFVLPTMPWTGHSHPVVAA